MNQRSPHPAEVLARRVGSVNALSMMRAALVFDARTPMHGFGRFLQLARDLADGARVSNGHVFIRHGGCAQCEASDDVEPLRK